MSNNTESVEGKVETAAPQLGSSGGTCVQSPWQRLEQAKDVAGACKEFVMQHGVISVKGKKYVKVEGWNTIADMAGFRLAASNARKDGAGFTADGSVYRESDGVIVSTGQGFVSKEEKRWKSADEYACRAMAQTRAMSRAARSAFAHIVKFIDAGLQTTPAEEVPPGGFDNSTKTPVATLKKEMAGATDIKALAVVAAKFNAQYPAGAQWDSERAAMREVFVTAQSRISKKSS